MSLGLRSFIGRWLRHYRTLPSSYMFMRRSRQIYKQCRDFTMIPRDWFVDNLCLIDTVRDVPGCVVECGVWRGGMSAGMALLLGPRRKYYLFDSFEGMPPVMPIDGEAANRWQRNKEAPGYYNNCSAPEEFAINAMKMTAVPSFETIRGWFDQTIPKWTAKESIAILRLDGDWYDSTMTCLEHLFYRVSSGGIVIIDDYYTWDGCSRAVHDFLSRHSRTERIRSFGYLAYLVKEVESGAKSDTKV